MIEQRTAIDQIEITRSGVIQIRFSKEIVDAESGQVLAREWHRTTIEPGTDPASQIAAVNTQLATMGRAAVADADTLGVLLPSLVALIHTPDVVDVFQAGARPS